MSEVPTILASTKPLPLSEEVSGMNRYFTGEARQKGTRELVIYDRPIQVSDPESEEDVDVFYSLLDLTDVTSIEELTEGEQVLLNRLVKLANGAYLKRGILMPESPESTITASAYFGKHVLMAWYTDRDETKHPISAVAFKITGDVNELPMAGDFIGKPLNFIRRSSADEFVELGKLAADIKWQNTLSMKFVLGKGTMYLILALAAFLAQKRKSANVMLTAWTTYLPEMNDGWKDPSGWMFATIAIGVASLLLQNYNAKLDIGLVGVEDITDFHAWGEAIGIGNQSKRLSISQKVLRTLHTLGIISHDNGDNPSPVYQIFSQASCTTLGIDDLSSTFSNRAREVFAGMYQKWGECIETKQCPIVGGPATIWRMYFFRNGN